MKINKRKIRHTLWQLGGMTTSKEYLSQTEAGWTFGKSSLNPKMSFVDLIFLRAHIVTGDDGGSEVGHQLM